MEGAPALRRIERGGSGLGIAAGMVMEISFRLNGEMQRVEAAPTLSLLDWLRESADLTGTKEGCNEGDCGACTVMIADERGPRAVNACLLLMPQIAGKSVTTVEGLGGTHPVQEMMVAHHGAQCGFCTPGVVMALAAGHANGRVDHKTVLAGNLCRCTGYAPILRAAEAAAPLPAPRFDFSQIPLGEEARAPLGANSPPLKTADANSPPLNQAPPPLLPQSLDELAALTRQHPEATLIAGGTDIGLWLTKGLQTLAQPIFLHQIPELSGISPLGDRLRIGAMTRVETLRVALAQSHPALSRMLARFASDQIRQMATIGGNIANGSPIGDLPPALIALGARLHLRHGDTSREIALEDFFLAYKRQDRQAGEIVVAVDIPATAPDLAVDKLSKRADQDISAVLMALDLRLEAGRIAYIRTGFGGMAGVPARARHLEAALLGASLPEAQTRLDALAQDFAPLSDLRASKDYRLKAAAGMIARHLASLEAPR